MSYLEKDPDFSNFSYRVERTMSLIRDQLVRSPDLYNRVLTDDKDAFFLVTGRYRDTVSKGAELVNIMVYPLIARVAADMAATLAARGQGRVTPAPASEEVEPAPEDPDLGTYRVADEPSAGDLAWDNHGVLQLVGEPVRRCLPSGRVVSAMAVPVGYLDHPGEPAAQSILGDLSRALPLVLVAEAERPAGVYRAVALARCGEDMSRSDLHLQLWYWLLGARRSGAVRVLALRAGGQDAEGRRELLHAFACGASVTELSLGEKS